MERVSYQNLRFAVEMHIADSVDDPVAARDLANTLMRQFVLAMATSQIKQAAAKRSFVTFRRGAQSKLPSWAYRKPGTDSRLPQL